MNDTDQTSFGLFLLSLCFWLATSGVSLIPSPVEDAAQVQSGNAQHVDTLLTQK
jgi:hypothetical protein